MIRLNLSKEPRWFDLAAGVRVKVAPITTALVMAARRDPEFAAASAGDDMAAAEVALVRALGRLAILEWEGVGTDEGEAAPVTPEGVGALLDIWPIYRSWSDDVLSRIYTLEQEKNASAASPIGSSEEAENTAARARGPAKTARRK